MKNRLGHEDRKRRIEAIQENVKTQRGMGLNPIAIGRERERNKRERNINHEHIPASASSTTVKPSLHTFRCWIVTIEDMPCCANSSLRGEVQ